MYYLIYETTNIINKKKYIGKHITDNISDEYIGSGTVLLKSVKKYGKQNFIKNILFMFDNEEDMVNKEKELVNLDVINSPYFYNIALGGQGGCIVLKEGHPQRDLTIKKISNTHLKNTKKKSECAKKLHKEKRIGMYGKEHTEETKELMSKNSQRLSGKNHPNFGKHRTTETKQKLHDANVGKKLTNEHIQKIKDNHYVVSGENNPMYGKEHTEETKEILRLKATGRKKTILNKKMECPHCKRLITSNVFNRWHNDNCKDKPICQL